MLKTFAAGLLASSMALPVLAQTSPMTQTATGATNPGSAATSGQGKNASGTSTGNVQFIQAREPGHYRSSELVGRDVYGANNEDIGEINDVLIDRSGRVTAVLLGVGGFLGLGEKDVAVPMGALQFQPNPAYSAANTGAAGTMDKAANAPATTGTTAPARSPAGTPANTGITGTTTGVEMGANVRANYPERIMVSLTRQQLEQAPGFRDDTRTRNVMAPRP